MRIAVVDDEAAMREQLVSYISRFGQENGLELTTTVFPSGDAFWERFARDWDIIHFDIDMPGTNGIDTAPGSGRTAASPWCCSIRARRTPRSVCA